MKRMKLSALIIAPLLFSCGGTQESEPIPTISSETVTYTVTFKNYDDTVLYSVDVDEGTGASYVGEEPSKPEDDEFYYVFIGWDKDLTNITSDTVTIARFEEKAKTDWGDITWF